MVDIEKILILSDHLSWLYTFLIWPVCVYTLYKYMCNNNAKACMLQMMQLFFVPFLFCWKWVMSVLMLNVLLDTQHHMYLS